MIFPENIKILETRRISGIPIHNRKKEHLEKFYITFRKPSLKGLDKSQSQKGNNLPSVVFIGLKLKYLFARQIVNVQMRVITQ